MYYQAMEQGRPLEDFSNENILNYIFQEFNKFISSQDVCDSKERASQYGHRRVLREILKSEEKYLACLRTILRLKTDLDPGLNGEKFIKKDDFEIIFFKAQELHDLHKEFHDRLKQQVVSGHCSRLLTVLGGELNWSWPARPEL